MTDWTKLARIKASTYRSRILCELTKEIPKTPSELRELTGIPISHVSQKLSELIDLGLVTCLTPHIRRGKLFSITDEGEEIIRHLKCRREVT